MEKDLPDDFAIALGRVLYLGGRVEMLLDRFLVPAGNEPPRRGWSGKQLITALREIPNRGTRLEEIIDGYEKMHESRNHLVHGAHNYANGRLWTWREPTGARAGAAFSFQWTLESLQQTAQSWQNLADAAHDELHLREKQAPDH